MRMTAPPPAPLYLTFYRKQRAASAWARVVARALIHYRRRIGIATTVNLNLSK